MTNVSKGDLALVMGCHDPRFNGAICEVLGAPPEPLPRAQTFDCAYWFVRFARPMPWSNMGRGGDCHEGSFPDCWLRKLGGPDVAESERVLRERVREVCPIMTIPVLA